MKPPWSRSLLAHNALLLIALALTLEFSVTATFQQLVLKPRAEGLAMLIASQINTQIILLSALPPADRAEAIRRINAQGQLRITPTGYDDEPHSETDSTWLEDFSRDLEGQLPYDSQLVITSSGTARMHMQIGQESYLFSLPLHMRLRNQALAMAAIVLGLVVGLNILAAWLIQRRINQPLQQLQRAAHALGSGLQPGRLPEDGPHELAAVARQFNRMAEHLEHNESTRTLMLAGISHDIRTPLTKLRLSLAMGHLDEQATTAYINQIDAIIGQFLDFGRAEGDEVAVTLNINTLVRQLAAEFDERGDAFALHLDATVPAIPLRALALQRAISNLMENAVRYGKEGLAVETWLQGDHVGVCVSDRGPGIPPDQIEYLMRPFTRADCARTGNRGTGLGLAIVDRLSRIHGGYLRMETAPEGGLRATIVLPLRAAQG